MDDPLKSPQLPKAELQMDGYTVLVADDHAPIRKAIKGVLNRMECGQVIEASDGIRAVQALEEGYVDLVIVDLYMPRTDGFELIDWIRSRAIGMDLPIIVVTGEASKDDILKSVDLGANDYLVKPFHPEDLEKKVRRILESRANPSESMQLVIDAEKALLDGKHDHLLPTIERAIKLEPDNTRAKHLKGEALARMGDKKAAVEWLKQCTEDHPSYFHFYRTLADLHLALDQFAEAITTIKVELDLHPKNAKRQVLLGKLLLDRQKSEDAISHFRIALRENNKLPSALLGMGRAYADLDNVEKAVYYFKRLRRHRPKSTKALEAIVTVALESNEPRKAEIALKDEKGAHPDRLDTYIVLAKFYLACDRREDALKVARELYEKHPEYKEGLQFRAELLMHLEMYREALDAFQTLKKHKIDAKVIIRIGECQLNLGRVREALDEFHKALRLGDDPRHAIAGLAESYSRTDQHHKAYLTYARLAKAGSLSPDQQQKASAAKQKLVEMRKKVRRAS